MRVSEGLQALIKTFPLSIGPATPKRCRKGAVRRLPPATSTARADRVVLRLHAVENGAWLNRDAS